MARSNDLGLAVIEPAAADIARYPLFQKAEILAISAAGRTSTDIARTFQVHRATDSASPATPTATDRRAAYRCEKADSLMISIGCCGHRCATN
jgi:hypothetical protein